MASVVTRPPLQKSPSTPTPSLSLNTSIRGTPAAIPNKHLPTCSPGPHPSGNRLSSPFTPLSPSVATPVVETSSLLHPPNEYLKVASRPTIYGLSAKQLHAALEHAASQPLPNPAMVFPWLHGLHPDNNLQLAFFVARKKASRRVPRSIRSITLVKAGGDLSSSKIKGTVAPEEILCTGIKLSEEPTFIDADPKDGFSVRNFQIQAAKMATVSDIVVYGDDQTPKAEIKRLAERIARAQKAWRLRDMEAGAERPIFSTFVLLGAFLSRAPLYCPANVINPDPFSKVEEEYPQIVSIGSNNCLTGNVLDFCGCPTCCFK